MEFGHDRASDTTIIEHLNTMKGIDANFIDTILQIFTAKAKVYERMHFDIHGLLTNKDPIIQTQCYSEILQNHNNLTEELEQKYHQKYESVFNHKLHLQKQINSLYYNRIYNQNSDSDSSNSNEIETLKTTIDIDTISDDISTTNNRKRRQSDIHNTIDNTHKQTTKDPTKRCSKKRKLSTDHVFSNEMTISTKSLPFLTLPIFKINDELNKLKLHGKEEDKSNDSYMSDSDSEPPFPNEEERYHMLSVHDPEYKKLTAHHQHCTNNYNKIITPKIKICKTEKKDNSDHVKLVKELEKVNEFKKIDTSMHVHSKMEYIPYEPLLLDIKPQFTEKEKETIIKFENIVINIQNNDNTNEVVCQLSQLMHQHKYAKYKGDIIFHIGFTYEKAFCYAQAITFYKTRTQMTPQSACVWQHLALCEQKCDANDNTKNNDFVTSFIKSWQYSVSPKYVGLKQTWADNLALQLEMFSSMESAIALARYYIDKFNGCNDLSIMWYKGAINLMEYSGKLQWKLDSVKKMENKNKYNFRKLRRRYLVSAVGGAAVDGGTFGICLSALQEYFHCLIERFRKDGYVFDYFDGQQVVIEIEKSDCFIRWNKHKEKFGNDFECFLKYEIGQIFEIIHLFCKEDGPSKMDLEVFANEIATFYMNYGAYQHDVMNDYENAETWYLESLQWNYDNSTTHWNLGEVYKIVNMNIDAKKHFQIFVDLSVNEQKEIAQRDVDQKLKEMLIK